MPGRTWCISCLRILLIVYAILGALAVSAKADDVVLRGLTPGEYYAKIVVATDGTMTVLPLRSVGLTPNPNPPTPPGPLSPNATQIRDVALAVTGDPNRAETAQGLAEINRQIAKLVRSNQITDMATLVLAVGTARDKWLNDRKVLSAWQAVTDVFRTEWTTVSLKSPPPTLLSFADLLDECASGLDASAPTKAINPDVLKMILQIIELIMQLIHPPTPVPGH